MTSASNDNRKPATIVGNIWWNDIRCGEQASVASNLGFSIDPNELQGWLVFIDSIVVYDTCRHYLPASDPCDWGVVQNTSIPPGSIQPPEPFGGWKVNPAFPTFCSESFSVFSVVNTNRNSAGYRGPGRPRISPRSAPPHLPLHGPAPSSCSSSSPPCLTARSC